MNRLFDLLGMRAADGEIVVVTPRGVLIPIGNAPDGWTVVEFNRLLSQIDGLPEVAHPLGARA